VGRTPAAAVAHIPAVAVRIPAAVVRIPVAVVRIPVAVHHRQDTLAAPRT